MSFSRVTAIDLAIKFLSLSRTVREREDMSGCTWARFLTP